MTKEIRSADRFSGKAAALVVTDPWDVGEVIGPDALACRIVMAGYTGEAQGFVIELEKPFFYSDKNRRYFVARARELGTDLLALQPGDSVTVGLTSVDDEHIRSADPLDISWWRGGLSMFGDLTLSC